MTQVQAPNGEVIDFPDNMSDADITAAMRRLFGQGGGAALTGASRTTNQGFSLADTWPARLAQTAMSAATLPADVYAGRAPMPIGTRREDFTDIPGSMQPQDRTIQRAADLAALVTPMNPAARIGDQAIPGAARSLVPQRPAVPTAEQLKQAADAGYAAARNSGVEIAAPSVDTLARSIRQTLEQDGIIGELAPKTFAVIGKLQNPPSGSVATVAGIDAARRAFGHAAGDFTNKTEQLAAKRAIERLDEFMAALPPQSVVAGTPAAVANVGNVFRDARGNFAAASRSEKVTGAADRAELNAAVANSGQNLDNATRQRLRDILVRPKESRGYSPQELAQMETAARGTLPTNAARFTGNLLGGGGGLAAQTSGAIGGVLGAAATGSPIGAVAAVVPPTAGYAFKKLANALTKRQVGKLDEMVRKRSPLYEQTVANPVMAVTDPAKRSALARLLLEMQASEQQ